MNSTNHHKTVLTRFKKGPDLLEQAISGLQDADLDASPSGGGWTIRQIVHHIVDGDDLWKAGIKAALGNKDGEFTLSWYWTRTQQEWAESWGYAHRSLAPSIALFQANIDHVVQLIEQIPDAFSRTIGVLNPDGEVEKVSVEFVLTMQADHVEHHLKQVQVIRNEGKSI